MRLAAGPVQAPAMVMASTVFEIYRKKDKSARW
jgi:hypothetical protein